MIAIAITMVYATFIMEIAYVMKTARERAGSLKRDPCGKLLWKKPLSHVEVTLIQDIERAARVFFTSVYALQCAARLDHLRKHERDFWKRYETACRVYKEARRDTESIYHIILCLRARLPHNICTETVKFLCGFIDG